MCDLKIYNINENLNIKNYLHLLKLLKEEKKRKNEPVQKHTSMFDYRELRCELNSPHSSYSIKHILVSKFYKILQRVSQTTLSTFISHEKFEGYFTNILLFLGLRALSNFRFSKGLLWGTCIWWAGCDRNRSDELINCMDPGHGGSFLGSFDSKRYEQT